MGENQLDLTPCHGKQQLLSGPKAHHFAVAQSSVRVLSWALPIVARNFLKDQGDLKLSLVLTTGQ